MLWFSLDRPRPVNSWYFRAVIPEIVALDQDTNRRIDLEKEQPDNCVC